MLYSEFYSLDHNVEETAIAAYWITDGIDRCRVGFLPRHCVRHANQFDGHIVQVVALLAHSENASERKHSRNNSGVCCACIIDSKMTSIANLNEPPQRQEAAAARIHALASSILAGGSDSDEDTDE
jgi:hypothetical protein